MIPQTPAAQMTLQFDPAITDQHGSLKDCVAASIYRQRGGIRAVAGRLDLSPSHLSEVLGGGGERNRKFDLDELERYIHEFKDFTPIHYLCAKFLGDQTADQSAAIEQLRVQMDQLIETMGRAGLAKAKRK